MLYSVAGRDSRGYDIVQFDTFLSCPVDPKYSMDLKIVRNNLPDLFSPNAIRVVRYLMKGLEQSIGVREMKKALSNACKTSAVTF